jgi:hypothetical protein
MRKRRVEILPGSLKFFDAFLPVLTPDKSERGFSDL